MSRHAEQGDLLELSGDKKRVLVLSKNFFNQSGLCILCPVISDAPEDALHIQIQTEKDTGVALCEHLKTLDLARRHYRKLGTIPFAQVQEITDAVQSIFDYYPFG